MVGVSRGRPFAGEKARIPEGRQSFWFREGMGLGGGFGFGKEWVWVAVLMGEEGLWVDGRGGPVGCHFSIERMRNDGNLCGVSIGEERL